MGGVYEPFEAVVRLDADGGLADIIDPDSPQLMAVPVVTTSSGTWPSGSGAVQVVSFLFVFAESCSGGEVIGRVVMADVAPEDVGGTTGGATGGSGVEHIRLVSGP